MLRAAPSAARPLAHSAVVTSSAGGRGQSAVTACLVDKRRKRAVGR